MGEYAKRLHDNEDIKIGTCENMYYLRYEDRGLVAPIHGNLDPLGDAHKHGLRFRLPFPDEDDCLPGEYQEYNRGVRLFRMLKDHMGRDYHEDYTIESDTVGLIQLTHPSGLLLNVDCHHGAKLPDVGPGARAFWNGKSWAIELVQVKAMPDGSVAPIIACRHCGEKWRSTWESVIPYIHDDQLLRRLLVHSNYKAAA